MSIRSTLLLATFLGLIVARPDLAAADGHAAIAPYLTDDVIGVAYVDLEKIDVPQAIDELVRLNIVPQDEAERARANAADVQAMYAELPKRGAVRAYVLLRVSDLFTGGPSWIIETKDAASAGRVMEIMPDWVKLAGGLGDASDIAPNALVADGAFVLGASSGEKLMALRESSKLAPRADAVAALADLGDADVGAVIFADAESRRVLREMFPQLPAPFMEIDGKLLADGIQSAAVAVKLPPEFQISLMIDGVTPEIAATLKNSVDKGMVLAKGLLMKEMVGGPPAHQERAKGLLPALSLVAPQVEGTRLSVTFGDDEPEVALMRDFVPAMTQKMRDELYRKSRMNNFKQVCLALHNHESARQAFPAAASYDAEGRPLLSWRVHILPYMEQMKLYNQFRLDEPWDSEHNRKLIDQMPELYTDPNPTVRAAIGDRGRTTVVAPRAEGTVFGGRDGIKHSDIKDGGSNTILAVEVVPERAVVWTKPDDWEVDLSNPLNGVKRSDREGFVAAWGDGHASFIPNDADAEEFRGNLTYAGGEESKP
jgi:hypothetical protein